MANFPRIIFTQDGLNMLMQAEGKNTSLIFTAVKLGDGQLAEGQNQKTFTDLIAPKLSLPIANIDKTVAGQITLSATVNNSTVDKGFFGREIGIYAKINETGTEKLYAYSNAGNYADYITDKSVPINEDIFRITLAVGNAANVEVSINNSIVYQTIKQSNIDIAAAVNKHNTDPNAHSAIMSGVKKQVTAAVADLQQQAKTVSDNVNQTIAKIDVPAAINKHNTAPDAHNDIRQLIAKAVASATPVGTITPFAGQSAPDGYLICDGSAVSRITYATLFKAISTTYGTGDGSTTFNLPDLQGRTIIGVSSSYGLSATGGEEYHTLTNSEMPSHSHSGSTDSSGSHHHYLSVGQSCYECGIGDGTRRGVQESPTTDDGGSHSHNVYINSTGGGQSHNNMQPYMALNYIIKY